MKHFLFIVSFICLSLPALARQTITGRVLSASDNTPLAGASVRLKDSSTGTTTGRSGEFTLRVSGSRVTIIVSYVGFKTTELTISLPLKRPLEILLEPSAESLQEVSVSTGYQTLPRERSTGSFSQVDRRTLNQQVSTDVISRLEAVANGLVVGRTNNTGITIRGLSTILGDKGPLIVLDNFPYEGDINNINPNEVASITLLKDAAAASIWGARAGNGVIVITTKKGRFNQPLSVDFSSNVSLTGKPDLFYLRQMSSSDFIDVEQMLYEKGYYNDKLSSPGKPALSPVVELLDQAGRTVSAEEAKAQIDSWRSLDVRNDYRQYLYRSAVNQQYALSLTGGSGQMAWAASGGYDRNVSNLDAAYNRASLNFNSSMKPLKNLQLSAAITYTRSESATGRPGYGEIYANTSYLYPYARLADEQGNALPLARNYRSSYTDTAGRGKLADWRYFPLEEYNHTPGTTITRDALMNFGLNYRLAEGLNLDLKYQYEQQQREGRQLYDAGSFYARNLVNSFAQLSSNGTLSYPVPPGGVLDLLQQDLSVNNARAQINFDRSIGRHTIVALAGAELRSSRTLANAHRSYGYNPDVLSFGNVDYSVTYPSFVDGSTSFIPNKDSYDDFLGRYVSLFANAAYTWQGKYTLSASARRDASNLFGVKTNDRWNPLWSAGLAWDLSRESFYKLTWLPDLKLRATYGFSGNVNSSLAAVTTIQYFGTNPYLFTPYTIFSNYANPELKWETSRMLNLAADFRTRDSRLRGSVEYYRKKGTDLLGPSLIDYTSGTGSSITKNVASMKGRGVDIELNSVNIKGTLGWTTSFNLSFYKDEVTSYYLFSQQGASFVGLNSRIAGIVGRPVYSALAFRWGGLDPQTGDPQGYVNGELSKDYAALTGSGTAIDDLVYKGPAMPTAFGSMGNTLSWKGFSLTARLLYKFGSYFTRPSIDYSSLFSNGAGHSDYALRWQQPGDENTTSVPSVAYPANSRRDQFYRGSEVLVEKGDNIRLQYVNLSYDIGQQKLRTLPFKSLEVFLNLNNLGILWGANKQNLDPDYAFSDTSIPPALTVAAGIRASLK